MGLGECQSQGNKEVRKRPEREVHKCWVLNRSGATLTCIQDIGTAHDHERAATGDEIPGTPHRVAKSRSPV